MQTFRVKNIGSDRLETGNIGANVIRVTLDGQEFEFPTVILHQSELGMAKEANITLNTSLLQFVHRVTKKKRIDNDKMRDDIIDKLKSIMDANSGLLVDIFFQLWKNFPLQGLNKSTFYRFKRRPVA